MSFQPIVPLGGFAGWQFLQRTIDTQKEAFVEGAVISRSTDAFRERIGSIETAEQLMEDRQLLEVALGAFGLSEDINSKALIQQILEQGTQAEDALANRFTDKRYRALSEAFGFDGVLPNTQTEGFAETIINRYEEQQFQQAIGNVNNDMRLALNLRVELTDIADDNTGPDAKWFAIMGSPPLRSVFETALGFPSSFGSVDIDLQLTQFKERASSTFGTDQVTDFLDPENEEKLIRLFMIRSEAQSSSFASGGSVALTLLQSVPRLF